MALLAKPKPIEYYPGGPPHEVIDEFNQALDNYIEKWMSELHQHILDYEAETGEGGAKKPST